MLQRAGAADAAESKKAARQSRLVERKRGVLCICIGDGTTPRTAALAAYLTAWNCVSVDPAMREEWTGEAPHGVGRLRGISAPFEDFMEQTETLAAIRAAVAADSLGAPAGADAANGAAASEAGAVTQAGAASTSRDDEAASGGEVTHLLLLCVHAHHRFTGPAALSAVRAAFGDPPTTCIALPCCPTFNPTKDIGRSPDASFEDMAVFSDCRSVLVWRWEAGPDPAAAMEVCTMTTAEIEQAMRERETARMEKQYDAADRLQAELRRRGVTVGRGDGDVPTWKVQADGRSGAIVAAPV